MRSFYAIILVAGLLFASCSQKLTLQKRKYNKGFHVALSGGKSSAKKQQSPETVQLKEPENILVKEVLPLIELPAATEKSPSTPEPKQEAIAPVHQLISDAKHPFTEASEENRSVKETNRQQSKSAVSSKRKDIFSFFENIGRGLAIVYLLAIIIAVAYAIFSMVPFPLSLLYVAGIILVLALLAAIGQAV